MAVLAAFNPSPDAKIRQLAGLPAALGGSPQPMQPASLLVIQQEPAGWFLYRYAADGDPAGDTWHPTLDEAHGQAQFEYGLAPEAWTVMPDGCTEADDIVEALARVGRVPSR